SIADPATWPRARWTCPAGRTSRTAGWIPRDRRVDEGLLDDGAGARVPGAVRPGSAQWTHQPRAYGGRGARRHGARRRGDAVARGLQQGDGAATPRTPADRARRLACRAGKNGSRRRLGRVLREPARGSPLARSARALDRAPGPRHLRLRDAWRDPRPP